MIIKIFPKGTREVASSYFRAYLMGDELERRGHKVIFYPPPAYTGESRVSFRKRVSLIAEYVKALFFKRNEEIIFLQRTVYNKFFLGIVLVARILSRPNIVFDFDDAIFLNGENGRSIRRFLKAFIFTKISGAVITGSDFLHDWASRYNTNVHIVPTSVPFRTYGKFSKDSYEISTHLHIGWAGAGNAHSKNLKILPPVFRELLEEGVPFRFTIIGAQGNPEIYQMFEISGLNKKIIDWIDLSKREEMLRAIQTFDIGVMPLRDTHWTRGKCAFKAIEYMACGVPTICSPVGENNILIKNGESGFLASSTREWVDYIKALARDRSLRERIGKNGQETIYNRYSIEKNAAKLENIMQNLSGS